MQSIITPWVQVSQGDYVYFAASLCYTCIPHCISLLLTIKRAQLWVLV